MGPRFCREVLYDEKNQEIRKRTLFCKKIDLTPDRTRPNTPACSGSELINGSPDRPYKSLLFHFLLTKIFLVNLSNNI